MKQDPLITYSSLIPGVLYTLPGGFNLPPRERIRYEDAPPEMPKQRFVDRDTNGGPAPH